MQDLLINMIKLFRGSPSFMQSWIMVLFIFNPLSLTCICILALSFAEFLHGYLTAVCLLQEFFNTTVEFDYFTFL